MLGRVVAVTLAAASVERVLGQACYLDRPDLGVTCVSARAPPLARRPAHPAPPSPPPSLPPRYDLTGMTIAAPLSDNRNDSTSAQFDYYVGNRGQCGTDIAPSVGQLLSCLYTTGDDGTQTKGPAPAFQVDGNGNCKRLGDSAANGVFEVTFSNNNIGRTVRRPPRRPRARAPHPALTPYVSRPPARLRRTASTRRACACRTRAVTRARRPTERCCSAP